jgi:hypothetical protein
MKIEGGPKISTNFTVTARCSKLHHDAVRRQVALATPTVYGNEHVAHRRSESLQSHRFCPIYDWHSSEGAMHGGITDSYECAPGKNSR